MVRFLTVTAATFVFLFTPLEHYLVLMFCAVVIGEGVLNDYRYAPPLTVQEISMSKVDFKYECGDILKERVSGFKGVVMVRAEYSTGCVHYGLQSQELKDGNPQDWHWFDQSRLDLKKWQAVKFDVLSDITSGPMPSGPQC